jgi:hypothetical protein
MQNVNAIGSEVSFSDTRTCAATPLGHIGNPISELYPRSIENPKPKRISHVDAWVLIVDQVKPAILNGTAVRFDLSKG